MATIVRLDKRGTKVILKGIARPINDMRNYFNILGLKVDQNTQRTFRNQGARDGKPKWIGFNRGKGIGFQGSTTRTKLGTWNIRYGSDKIPKRSASQLRDWKTQHNLWYKPGKMKGYESERRYSSSSKLLQAGGGFRKSFRLRSVTKRQMVYGTNYADAMKIMSNPTRQVLSVTGGDKKKWKREFILFYKKNLKF